MPSLIRMPERRPLPLARPTLALLFGLAVTLTGASLPGQPAGARELLPASPVTTRTIDQTGLLAYRMVAQWPQRSEAAQGLFQSPSDLDMTRDGTVFIADPGVGGVHRLLSSGEWASPFGVTGGLPAQLGRVGPIAIGPDPNVPGFPFSAERVYVLDTAADRVVFYGPDGGYQGAWTGIKGQGIAAAMDGRVFVMDKETSEILVLDAFSGAQAFTFGVRGIEDGQFTNFMDLDVTADGKVVAVADKRGQRVQLFDLLSEEQRAADPALPVASLRKVYDLKDARFSQRDLACDASRINALGEDKVFVGQGDGACVIDGRTVSFAIAASAVNGSVCKATVTLPRLKAMSQQYYALAVSDPNVGKCGEKRSQLDTSPVVIEYGDEQLKQVTTVFQAASNDTSDSPLLFAPNALSMPEPGVIFISDNSSQFRFFSDAGLQIGTAERASSSGSFNGDFTFFQLIYADGSDVRGEVQGYYLKGQRQGQGFTVEGGIGRFKTVEKRGQTGVERIIEPIWTDALISSFNDIEVPALAYNPFSGEFLTVQSVSVPQQRTQDVQLVRYAKDGRKISPAWDLPDDGKTNPYVDMAVAPDGRILMLDDLADLVRIYSPAGQPLGEVPVAYDARSLAGGPLSPDGSVFVLREPGAIEQVADDGRISARLDARPLPFSDPTTLTDLVVDASGKVYVADGQSSLISVFDRAAAGDDEIPVPNDGECLFRGQASAAPAQMPLGAAATLSLRLDGRCGVLEPPTDIVVLVPYFLSLEQGRDPSAVTVNELTQLMSRLNFGRHRVGIVSYYSTYKTELPLTDDRQAYNAKVRDITRFDRSNPAIKPRLRDALEEAQKLFAGSGARRKVAVLLRAEYCTPDFEFFPGQCAGVPAAEDAALALRQEGVTIVVVNSGPGPESLASSDEDYVYGAPAVHRRMVKYAPPPVLATDLRLAAALPAGMAVDPASITGGGSWRAPDLAWQLASLDFDGLAASAALSPDKPGRVKLADTIRASFTDGWGKAQTVDFPIPEVDVIEPTATAVPPTSTAQATSTRVPPSATPEPSATSRPGRVFLPWVSNMLCFPVQKRFDIVVALDVSSSMRTDGRLETAKAAVAALLDAVKLAPDADQVALVDFAREGRLVLSFSHDRAAIDEAKAGITLREGTRIDRGLGASLDLLAGPAARPNAGQVVVLLSDGEQTDEPETALAAARLARERGVQVFTIGLGAEADAALLRQVATDPSQFYSAHSGADLAGVYGRIAASIPGCP